MPTFTIIVPSDCVVNLDGARRVDIRCVYGEVRLTIHTPPAPDRSILDDEDDEPAPRPYPPTPFPRAPWEEKPPVPVEYWQHDPDNGLPGWNGDGPATGPTGVERFDPEAEATGGFYTTDVNGDFDPESEANDPWLQGR
jgi:hypothetical protein